MYSIVFSILGIICVITGVHFGIEAMAAGEIDAVGLCGLMIMAGVGMIWGVISYHLPMKIEKSSEKPGSKSKPKPEPPQPVPEPVPPAPNPEPQPNGRVCQYCGAELAEGDIFCIECGRKV